MQIPLTLTSDVLDKVEVTARSWRRHLLKVHNCSDGLCLEFSKKVRAEFESIGIACNLVAGIFVCSRTSPYDGYGMQLMNIQGAPHYWLSVLTEQPSNQQLIVDITADQFRPWHKRYIPAVLISHYTEWPEYVVGAE